MSESHRNLVVWQKAMALVTAVYEATSTFPSREVFGLASQVHRAAVSIASNVAEGKGRMSRREYVHFLYQARGSLMEVETQLEIGLNLGYLPRDRFESLIEQADEVGRLLNGLIAAIKRRIADPSQAGNRKVTG